MGGEPAVQGLGQLRDFHPHAFLGKLGYGRRIGFAGKQGFQHRPRGGAVQISGDRGQFDPGVLEQLLQPLDLAGAVPSHGGTGAGQVAQLPDWFRWNERATDQTMGAELSKPGCIRDVGLAARQVLDVSGIDQHHLHAR